MEMRSVTFQGKPVAIKGRALNIGDIAPNFTAVKQGLEPFRLYDTGDKIKVITSFPSLDTPVCDLQVKEFNKRAVALSGDVVVIGVSMDLPFAQARFCELNEIKNVLVVSDYLARSFAFNYGLYLKGLGLTARAIIIAGQNNEIVYQQVVSEITNAPDYDEAFDALGKLIKGKVDDASEAVVCKPCSGSTLPLSGAIVEKELEKVNGWQYINNAIVKKIKLRNFKEVMLMADIISAIAEEQGHHPDMVCHYNVLEVSLTTHAINGLSQNDFIMASIIDRIR